MANNCKHEPSVTMDEVLYELSVYLDVRGYTLVPDALGHYNGWDIYQRDLILIDGCLAMGAKRMTKVGDNTRALKQHIRSWLNFEYVSNRSETWMEKAYSIYISLFESHTKSNIMDSVSHSADRVNISLLDTQGGTGYGYKVLPVRQFVPNNVKDLDVRELLHVFPEAEADMLMMMLGRGLWGAKGQKTLDGTVLEHRWSGWCLLQSDASGSGHSFFKETLEKVLVALGYKVASLKKGVPYMSGWLAAATSDFTWADGFTAASQRAFVVEGYVNIIARSGSLPSEVSSRDFGTVKATSVIIGCTDDNTQAQYNGALAGHLNRANVLSVKPKWVLAKTAREYTLEAQWQALAAKYDTTVEALMIHLLVKSQEMFKETLDAGELYETYTELRSQYAVKPE